MFITKFKNTYMASMRNFVIYSQKTLKRKAKFQIVI